MEQINVIKEQIAADILGHISSIEGALGTKAYAAGGCVRDFYVGKTPKDFDILVHFPDLATGFNQPMQEWLESIRQDLQIYYPDCVLAIYCNYGDAGETHFSNTYYGLIKITNPKDADFQNVDVLICIDDVLTTIQGFNSNLNRRFMEVDFEGKININSALVGLNPTIGFELSADSTPDVAHKLFNHWLTYYNQKVF